MTGKHTGASEKNEKRVISQNNVSPNLLLTPVCIDIKCPNRHTCMMKGTATFRILGDICTRNCTYCYFPHGKPAPVNPEEPLSIARAVKHFNLKYVTITSVSRDDLSDGGASQFANVVNAVHEISPDTSVEILIHDFSGNADALKIIADSNPEVIAHNFDTVPRLYDEVKPDTDYTRSLGLLESLKKWNPDIVTKSGMLLGLGENDYEVIKVMEDVKDSGCNCLTIGQYLPPSNRHFGMVRYVTSQEFDDYKSLSLQMGYLAARSSPLVRYSFDAYEMYKEIAQ